MKNIRVLIMALVVLLWGLAPVWAQYDMRRSTNPYAGMGRTGFALEERDKKLQEQKEAQKAKDAAAKQKKQNPTAPVNTRTYPIQNQKK